MKRKRGVVTAFVHEVDAARGRVKVEYKHIQEGLMSPWAPVAGAMSGKGRGALFMPEKDDQVLVGFHDGDFAHPYILGFVWNGEQVSPEREAHHRVIVTPGGHQLRFEDKANDTRIILKSAGGHQITLEDKPSGPRVEIATNGQRRILLDDMPGTGKVQITSGQHQITLDDTPGAARVEIRAGAAGTVTITLNPTTGALAITAGGAITVTSTGVANVMCATANLTASAAANVTAGVFNVNAGIASFSGLLRASAIQTGAVISPLYTPGLGNLL